MKLNLIDTTTIDIFRVSCAHYIQNIYGDMCNWNINPVELVNSESPGYFAIGEWGCDGFWDYGKYIRTPEKFKMLIPIRSVVKISDVGIW